MPVVCSGVSGHVLELEISKTKKETTYRIPFPHLSHSGTFWAPGMAEGIFVTGAFTLLVPMGRPSENQNNPVMCRLIQKHLVQLNTFPVNTLLNVFTGFHLYQQTMEFLSTLYRFTGPDSTSLELGKILCSCSQKARIYTYVYIYICTYNIYVVLSVSMTSSNSLIVGFAYSRRGRRI